MIKMIKIVATIIFAMFLNSCASGYKTIEPQTLNYSSKSLENNILLEYKYDLLENKYKKKETQNEVKLIAVKITNNSEKELLLGRDFKLAFDNGTEVKTIETEKLYKTIKQKPAYYLFYLLLSPMQLYSGTKTTTNGPITKTEPANSYPIGLIIGPGIAGGNMIVASSANEKFKDELNAYDLNGKTIKKGETVYGLIGIESNSAEALKIKINNEIPLKDGALQPY